MQSSKLRNVAVLGSTGSIGTQTLDVIEHLGTKFNVFALSTEKNTELLFYQCRKFNPEILVVGDEGLVPSLKNLFPDKEIMVGEDGLCYVARHPDVHIVVNAIAGSSGFMPSIEALQSGKRLCIANKETIVMAGKFLMDIAKTTNAQIFPIDSEHSALWQASLAGEKKEIARIILTASGGPFFGKDVDWESVTPEEALAHPNWHMGKKVSVDSATMVNKALEIIEARWLFDIEPEKIDVLIHPQSVVHSIVEFVDGSQIAQLSTPDMRLPIQYSLTYPCRFKSPVKNLDISLIGHLDFYTPDMDKFPALKLAYRVLNYGGTAPAIFSTVDEEAVTAFLNGKIKFSQIVPICERAVEEIPFESECTVKSIMNAVLSAQEWFRKRVYEE